MKIKLENCLRCGYNPKEEKSIGCSHWGKFISKNHLYTIECDKKEIENLKESGHKFKTINK